MAFGADGQVTGTSGCNSYGGPYSRRRRHPGRRARIDSDPL
jgi:heat shock protein HslJ